MERIAHRELRSHSSEILHRVAAGESFEITNHDDVVAVLSPPNDKLRLRVVKPGTRNGRWSELRPAVVPGRPMQDILDGLREERP